MCIHGALGQKLGYTSSISFNPQVLEVLKAKFSFIQAFLNN